MKISNDNNYNIQNETDFYELISNFKEQYDEVYWNNIDGIMFVYRVLGRKEYKNLLKLEASDIEKEDIVCSTCLLYPENFDFDEVSAGIPTQLFKNILKNSFLDSLESKKLLLAYNRNQMDEFDNQITCIINEAFPNIDISEIEEWNMAKTAKYLSRAEWKLNVLRQVPVDYEVSDKLMENEWYNMHRNISENDDDINELENESINNVDTSSTDGINTTEFIPGESLEQRQERLKKNGVRQKSKEELERLQKAFPEINWTEQVDIDNMNDSTDPVALRPGY